MFTELEENEKKKKKKSHSWERLCQGVGGIGYRVPEKGTFGLALTKK